VNDVSELEPEVVIVGGGLAGLAAAWDLRDRDILVLEASDRPGGRVRTVSRGSYWANLGAHILSPGDSLAGGLCREFDVPMRLPLGSVTAVSMNGKLMRGGRPETWPFRLAMPMPARLSMIRVGVRLRAALGRSRRVGPASLVAEGSSPLESLPLDATLDGMTLADVIGPAHPQVKSLLRSSANRAGGELDTLSAQYGVESSLGAVAAQRANIVGGTEVLIDAFAERLGRRLRLNAEVASVVLHEGHVEVHFSDAAALAVIRAKTAIIATPAPIARRVMLQMPNAKGAALDQVMYAPWIVAAIFTRESVAMPWDDLYAVALVARHVAMAFNPANSLRGGSGRLPGGALVCYAAGDRAGELMSASDSAIADRFLTDLGSTFPGLRNVVDEIAIQRWPFGGPVSGPGRIARQPFLAQPVGRVAFAGDYILYPGLDNAVATGRAAAAHVRSYLPESVGMGA
jgi:oxygen-dependent protoporphyrinogen oxidase